MADLLDALPVTRDEKRACIERELRFRRRVYARKVAAGTMKRDAMEKELRVMSAILADYDGANS